MESLGSFSDEASRNESTRASGILREYFTSKIVDNIRFDDRQRHLARLLRGFTGGEDDEVVINVRRNIKSATIIVSRPKPTGDNWSTAADYPESQEEVDNGLVMVIIKCLSLMTEVRDLTLDLNRLTLDQQMQFSTFLGVMEKWNITRLRLVGGKRACLADVLIDHCNTDGLEVLDFHANDGLSDQSHAAAANHKGIKRPSITSHMMPLEPTLGHCLVGRVAVDFPKLEWLIISEPAGLDMSPTYNSLISPNMSHLRLLTDAIQELPKLERFAFELQTSTVVELLRSDQEARKLVRSRPAGGLPTTEHAARNNRALLDRWHIRLLSYLSERLPDILIICILADFPRYYLGSRAIPGDPMVLEAEVLGFQTNGGRFPAGLRD